MTKTTTALTDDLQFGADETRNAAPDDKDDKEFLWGAKAIAREIDAELRPTFHMLKQRYLPAAKVGGVWVTTRSRAPSKALTPKRGKKHQHTEPAPK